MDKAEVDLLYEKVSSYEKSVLDTYQKIGLPKNIDLKNEDHIVQWNERFKDLRYLQTLCFSVEKKEIVSREDVISKIHEKVNGIENGNRTVSLYKWVLHLKEQSAEYDRIEPAIMSFGKFKDPVMAFTVNLWLSTRHEKYFSV